MRGRAGGQNLLQTNKLKYCKQEGTIVASEQGAQTRGTGTEICMQAIT